MSNELRESLSALMDGEASELELRRILRDGDAQTNALWASLHLQRGALHGEPVFPAMDISARVRAAIEEEGPLQVNEPESIDKREAKPALEWRRPLAGMAVAASVAALVVFGLGGAPDAPTAAEPTLAAAPESSRVYLASPSQPSAGAVAASAVGSVVPRYQQVDDEQSRQRFEYFLQQHTERAALNNGQGMVTYARLVTHEAK